MVPPMDDADAQLPGPLTANRGALPAWAPVVILAGLLLALTWGYWDLLKELSRYWSLPPYALGWLVPVLAGIVLAVRWQAPASAEPMAPHGWGLMLLTAALVARLYAAYFGWATAEMLTLVPCVAGALVVAGGQPAVRWGGPAAALLLCMYPLPWGVANAMLDPMETAATKMSVFGLQTLGHEAYAEGNRIFVGGATEALVEPCARLCLAAVVVALALGVVLVFRRPWWERAVVLLSAAPIALLVNAVRITTAALLHQSGRRTAAETVLRHSAGWLMMPLALGLLLGEALLLAHLMRDTAADPAGDDESDLNDEEDVDALE
jgi:exosortase